jgi:mRNA-degrading endonuclease toxin of MazEF toxin-antitoxin module
VAESKPEIGLVIRHAYLWWNEARVGREEGLKDRPCVIVHSRQNEHRETEVYIAPITRTRPEAPERALQIPQATKARLHLDAQASWIITTEVNRFIWPGPDIRAVPGGAAAYGLLPARMTRDLVQKIKDNARDRALLIIGRDDAVLSENLRQRRKSQNGKVRDRKR